MKRFMVACGLALSLGLLVQADPAKPAEKQPMVVAGEFVRIYDPSVGEGKKWYINDHCFIHGSDGLWHLFGITHQEPAAPLDERIFAHATARTLLQTPWDKQPPALAFAPEAPWKEEHLWAPHVICHEGTYYMFYCAGDKDHTKYKLHLATSKDLLTWTRHPKNPVVVDGFDARDPFILREGGQWLLYYTATSEPAGGNHIVACVTSTNLLDWGNKRVVYVDPARGTIGGPTESPFVVRRGKQYFLFVGPRPDYDGTDVFVSHDPFQWKIEDKVGHIPAHAAEVVRDTDGKWYVSRAGWDRGGVYLAPLTWQDGEADPATNLEVPKSAAPVGQTQRNSGKPANPGDISMGTLLGDMTNLAGMAEFPSPAYTCRQFSSYDRRSTSPAETKLCPPEAISFGLPFPPWFANKDCGQFLRVEERDGRKEYVMMDAEGPGAIVRIWTANPAGPVPNDRPTVRIFLDGADKPVIDAPMDVLLGGKYPGLPRPIAGESSKGCNLYVPIPYAKRCKVTSDKNEFYYHISYRTYPADTKVVTFASEQIALLDTELKALAVALNAPGTQNAPPAGAKTKPFDVVVEPGGVATVIGTFKGPAAVRRFRLAWTPSADRDEPALRAAVVQMTFDGETTVTAPLGDFFGSGPGINPYESLPLSVTQEGTMESRWVMPFKKSAVISVLNYGEEAVPLKGEIVTAPYAWTAATMHFHAKWRIEYDIPTRPLIDWNYLTATGKGVFAGVAFSIDNPGDGWWGEGDEKIYVDGETFPSHFGTGTEDYFGYGWCCQALFTHAYHNQTRCDAVGNWAGRTSLNRFHILDRIPFTKDFRFDMEMYHQNAGRRVNAAVLDYWYAMPGATDGFKPIEAASLILRGGKVRVKGALEGEAMRIVAKTGQVEPQEVAGASGGAQLWWRGGQKPGDTLVLGFKVPQAGKYRVFGRFVKAKDYGIAQFAINDQKAGKPLDFYNDGVILTPEIELGAFDLKAGENTLSVTIVGANEKADKQYMVGIDYLIRKN